MQPTNSDDLLVLIKNLAGYVHATGRGDIVVVPQLVELCRSVLSAQMVNEGPISPEEISELASMWLTVAEGDWLSWDDILALGRTRAEACRAFAELWFAAGYQDL